MKPEFIRNPYNYDSDLLSEETGLECKDETLTEQEYIEEADINYVAERFMRTGEAPQVLQLPTTGDFEGIFDFQSAMNTLAQAREEFMTLPAKTRTRFGNDPAQLLDFVNDKSNYDEAVKLGFIPPKGDNNGRSTQGNIGKATQEQTRPTGGTSSGEKTEGTSKP